jgi:hypothetical protein
VSTCQEKKTVFAMWFEPFEISKAVPQKLRPHRGTCLWVAQNQLVQSRNIGGAGIF